MPDDGAFPDSAPENQFSDDAGFSVDPGGQPIGGGVLTRILRLVANGAREFLDHVRQEARSLLESPDGFARGLRVIVIGTLAIAFLSVILLLIFYRPSSQAAGSMRASSGLSGTAAAGPVAAAPTPADTTMRQGNVAGSPGAGSPGGTLLSWISTPIEPFDFLVPRSDREALDGGVTWRLSRLPRNTWSQKDINRFWIDPTALVIEHLSKRNRDLIDGVFREVP